MLAESPDPNIANAAISLIVFRFARQPNASRSLLKDCDSTDETTRIQANQAAHFLRAWPLPPDLDRERLPFTTPSEDGDIFAPSEAESDEGFVSVSRRLHDHLAGVRGGSDGWVNQHQEVVPSTEDPVAGWTNVPRERPLDDGEEDWESRRRRREAMVLHEGEGRVVEGDIIRPRR